MHQYARKDHHHSWVDITMVQSSNQGQYKNKTCWLQTRIVTCVDGITEDYHYRVEQQRIRDVVGELRQDVVDHNREER